MDPAPQGIEPGAPPSPAPSALVEAPPPTAPAGLDRAAADLEGRAAIFARTPAKEKAALLRATLARVHAAAPELASVICHAAGVDAAGPLAGAAWLSGPIALIAAVRRFAEALEDVATAGRPFLPPSHLRGRLGGRVAARLSPRGLAERILHRGAEATALFAEGVQPEDAIAGQAAFYRRPEPEGGVALVVAAGGAPSAGPLRALDALFVEGKVTVLETAPSRAHLGPIVEQALAPLIEAGFLRIVHGGEAAGAHLAATLGEPRVSAAAGGPVLLVPAYYAKDELWFVARRLVAELAAGRAFGVPAPREIVVGNRWAQRGLLMDQIERAAASLPPHLSPRSFFSEGGIVETAADEPTAMLAEAVDRANAGPGAATAEIVVHVLHEEDPEVSAALERAMVGLRCGALGINQWPALIAFRGDTPEGPRMLSRVDKVIVRGPLRSARRPVYFGDARGGAARLARLSAFQAAPSLTAALRV